jgi:hypothetical protein
MSADNGWLIYHYEAATNKWFAIAHVFPTRDEAAEYVAPTCRPGPTRLRAPRRATSSAVSTRR